MNKIEKALQRTRDTKSCIIEKGAVSRTGAMFAELFPGKKAVVVADVNTWKVAGASVEASLTGAGITIDKPHIFDNPHFYAEWQFVEELHDILSATDAIAVAVGSGVINDLTKYVSGVLKRPYICVGTAVSMDGFTSYGASITKDGNKQTFDCPAPLGFIIDPVIAAEAPKELAASGYADLIAKIPAAADWMIADTLGVEKIDKFAWDLVQDGLKESLSDPAAVHAGDVAKTEGLAVGLVMSGFAMQAISSSRPASGTEHQFSHCWDMEALSYPDGRHVSHGFKVGIGTLVSTLELEYLLEKDIRGIDTDTVVSVWKTWPEMQEEIRGVCRGKDGHLARCLKETEGKYVDKDGLRRQVEALKEAWPTLSEDIRRQIIPFKEVYDDLKKVGAPYEPEQIFVSRKHLKETFDLIPFMRSRFTNIDLLYRLGYLEDFKKRLFGKGGIWEIID